MSLKMWEVLLILDLNEVVDVLGRIDVLGFYRGWLMGNSESGVVMSERRQSFEGSGGGRGRVHAEGGEHALEIGLFLEGV